MSRIAAAASATQADAQLLNIVLSDIRVSTAALRGVNHESPEFLGILNTVKADRVYNPIVVRESTPEDTLKDAKHYVLIDGLQRYTASVESGKTTIPANVVNKSDADALALQIMGNAHKVETKPVEFMKALVRLLAFFPMMTETELAGKLGISPQWVGKILGLSKLVETLKPLVNEGKIPVSNAFMLSKLPPEEQLSWSDRAQTTASTEFTPAVNARVKAIRDSNRAGKTPGEEQFVPIQKIRDKKELAAELESPTVGPALISQLKIADPAKDKNDAAAKGFQLGVQWALNFDPESIKAQKAKDDERRKKAADDKARRESEKAARDAAKAADNTAGAVAAASGAAASTAAPTAAPTTTAAAAPTVKAAKAPVGAP